MRRSAGDFSFCKCLFVQLHIELNGLDFLFLLGLKIKFLLKVIFVFWSSIHSYLGCNLVMRTVIQLAIILFQFNGLSFLDEPEFLVGESPLPSQFKWNTKCSTSLESGGT